MTIDKTISIKGDKVRYVKGQTVTLAGVEYRVVRVRGCCLDLERKIRASHIPVASPGPITEALRQRVESLTSDYQALASEYRKLTSDYQALKAENIALRQENEMLRKRKWWRWGK